MRDRPPLLGPPSPLRPVLCLLSPADGGPGEGGHGRASPTKPNGSPPTRPWVLGFWGAASRASLGLSRQMANSASASPMLSRRPIGRAGPRAYPLQSHVVNKDAELGRPGAAQRHSAESLPAQEVRDWDPRLQRRRSQQGRSTRPRPPVPPATPPHSYSLGQGRPGATCPCPPCPQGSSSASQA